MDDEIDKIIENAENTVANKLLSYKQLVDQLQKELQRERKISIILACTILILLVYSGMSGP